MGYFHAAETRQRGNDWEHLYLSYHSRAGWQSLQSGHEPSYSHLGCTCHTVLKMVKKIGAGLQGRGLPENADVFPVIIFLHPKSNACDPWATKQFLCNLSIHHFFSFSYTEINASMSASVVILFSLAFTVAIILKVHSFRTIAVKQRKQYSPSQEILL